MSRTICSRCVMDESDPDITFDDNGVCNHCLVYERNMRERVFSGAEGTRRLEPLVESIRSAGRGQRYDCVIGVSGGVDSTFVAFKVKEFGLRPLAVHLDNGWDSELAVANIQRALEKLGIDLFTTVLDWEEFKDLQLAFLRASTPDSEIPTDHAIVASMYEVAQAKGIRHIISGMNCRTESHLPRAWSQGHWDWRYIKSVHRKYGKKRLRTYPHMGIMRCEYLTRRHRQIGILDYLDYKKSDAMAILGERLGWQYYGGKHHESIYTRFYQGFWLPKKFGFDKRRMHLSSLVCAGEMGRDAALEELRKEPYPIEEQEQDREYICKKLGLSETEFETILALPKKRYEDYPTNQDIYDSRAFVLARSVYRFSRRALGLGPAFAE